MSNSARGVIENRPQYQIRFACVASAWQWSRCKRRTTSARLSHCSALMYQTAAADTLPTAVQTRRNRRMTWATWLEGDESMESGDNACNSPSENIRVIVQLVDGDEPQILEEPKTHLRYTLLAIDLWGAVPSPQVFVRQYGGMQHVLESQAARYLIAHDHGT